VLTAQRRLFVHAPLSRSLAVYDVADILDSHDFITKRLADISTVATDELSAEVLRGKQLFYNSADVRMSDQGYLSCASCHFDGGEDGRTWDFASVGEGVRNTISLLGRRGMGQGRLNWSGSFDELQDVDDNIRDLFGGKGFLSEEQVAMGGMKAGLSPELDAMAAFMTSLAAPRPSPFRKPDGSLTEDGVAGRAVFRKLGCGFCHTGTDTTDSAAGKRHDVGTLSESSGALLGLDTPTLNGVWETPPYLHDGSAATLRDVLGTNNADDRHAFTSELSERELTQLVSYVQQLDGTVDSEPGAGGSGGTATGTGGTMTASAPPPTEGCAVAPAHGGGSSLLLGLLLLLRRRRR
jgi:cytochrome c peroxidase